MGVGTSNFVIRWINFLTMLLAFAVVIFGVLMSTHRDSCRRFLTLPVLALGAFIFIVSIFGFLGVWKNNSILLWIGAAIKNLESGSNGHVSAIKLEDGSTIEADTVIIGIGAKPAVGPFERVGLNTNVGGIQVDGQFRTGIPGIFAIGYITGQQELNRYMLNSLIGHFLVLKFTLT